MRQQFELLWRLRLIELDSGWWWCVWIGWTWRPRRGWKSSVRDIIYFGRGKCSRHDDAGYWCYENYRATGAMKTIAGTTLSALAAALLATNTDISISTSYMPRSASVLVGAGAETTEIVFAANSTTVKTGYYVQRQDKMLLQAEVINYDPMAKDVYLSLVYEYIPNIEKGEGWLDVAMGAINVDGRARSANDAMSTLSIGDKGEETVTNHFNVYRTGVR